MQKQRRDQKVISRNRVKIEALGSNEFSSGARLNHLIALRIENIAHIAAMIERSREEVAELEATE